MAAALLALAGGGGAATPVASAELNHAAIVIDTADGNVRKFCLAFPEESIDGAEALRRIESQAVFGAYGGKGLAVCKLSGVGCPADDCFCDRSKYWAYHRAGPGGAPYKFSSSGVSSTVVQNGDVEGWRWGAGEAPPKATVSEVCGVAEPPARTSAGGGGGEPSPTTSPSPPTTSPPAAPPGPGDPTGTTAPAPGGEGSARQPAPASGPTVVAPPTGGGPAALGDPAEPTGAVDDAVTTTVATDAAAEEAAEEAAEVAARRRLPTDPTASRRAPDEGGTGGVLGLGAFVAILGGVLVWRGRLRRANVRP